MTILVTGASSYVAQAIIRHLRDKTFSVLATYRTHCPPVIDGVKLLHLDLSNKTAFRKLPKSVDAIVHVAAATPKHTVSEILGFTLQGLLPLQQYALDSCRGVFVLTSSVSIHGHIETSFVDETTPIVEPNIYGASKLLLERSLAVMSDRLPVLALRLPSVLSRLETEAWIPSLMRKFLAHEDITIFNPEAAFNNAIDVDELSRFVVSTITKNISGFHAFPLASSGSLTVTEVVNYLRSSVNSHSAVSINKTPQRSFTISSEYAEKFFGYEPINIRETLQRFVRRLST